LSCWVVVRVLAYIALRAMGIEFSSAVCKNFQGEQDQAIRQIYPQFESNSAVVHCLNAKEKAVFSRGDCVVVSNRRRLGNPGIVISAPFHDTSTVVDDEEPLADLVRVHEVVNVVWLYAYEELDVHVQQALVTAGCVLTSQQRLLCTKIVDRVPIACIDEIALARPHILFCPDIHQFSIVGLYSPATDTRKAFINRLPDPLESHALAFKHYHSMRLPYPQLYAEAARWKQHVKQLLEQFCKEKATGKGSMRMTPLDTGLGSFTLHLLDDCIIGQFNRQGDSLVCLLDTPSKMKAVLGVEALHVEYAKNSEVVVPSPIKLKYCAATDSLLISVSAMHYLNQHKEVAYSRTNTSFAKR
jgi:hypothetical protein